MVIASDHDHGLMWIESRANFGDTKRLIPHFHSEISSHQGSNDFPGSRIWSNIAKYEKRIQVKSGVSISC